MTTSATDTIIGTTGDDTITGAAGTVHDGDTIIDQSATDNDTANLVLTSNYTPSNITNIENINLDWDAFGTATYVLTNVKGAQNVTLTSQKVGFQGNATVTGINDVVLTAGAGMVGTLTASGFKTGTVEGGYAKGLVIDGTTTNASNESITVAAGANTTTVSVGAANGFKAADIDAGTAKTITVGDAGNTTDVTNLTVNANATITAGAAQVGTVNLTAHDGNGITMDAIGKALDVAGAGAITLNSIGLSTKTVTNNVDGTLTVVSSKTDDQDVSKVDADLIRFTGNVNNGALTFKTGANAELTNATVTLAKITGSAAKNEVVNLKASGAAITALTQDVSLETLNLTAAAPQVTGTDLTVDTLTLNANKLVVDGTNDVKFSNVANAGTVDASALNGALTLTQTGTTDILTVIGSETGKNTVEFTATAVASNYTGGEGDDIVTFAQESGAGVASATAVVGNGKNTVNANALTDGDLVVIGGNGVDTVNATAITAANVTLQLGDGNNVVTLGTADNNALDAATINIVTGSGNDKVTLNEATTDDTEINLTLGGGTDTLILDYVDYSKGTWNVSDLNAIEIVGGATTTTVAASLVSGETIAVSSTDPDAGNVFKVVGTKATGETIDLSNLVMDQTLNHYVASTSIVGNAGNDIITGTAINDTINVTNGNNTVTGGKGADDITLGAGTDTVVIAQGDTGITAETIDKITGFTSGTDKLQLGVAATATNYVELADDDYGLDLDAAKTAADSALNGTVKYVFAGDTDAAGTSALTGYLFIDYDMDGTADAAIELSGLQAATFAQGDIIA